MAIKKRRTKAEAERSILGSIGRELEEAASGEGFHDRVAAILHRACGCLFALVNRYDESSGELLLTGAWMGSELRRVARRELGASPAGLRVKLSDERVRRELMSGACVRIPGGFEVLGLGAVSRSAGEELDRAAGARAMYAKGFVWRGRLLGNAVIGCEQELEPERLELVDAVMRIAAIAMQRMEADTERERAERLDAYADSSVNCGYLWDAGLRLMWVNARGRMMLEGGRAKGFIGMRMSETLPLFAGARYRKLYRRVLQSKEMQEFSAHLVDDNHGDMHVLVRLFPVGAGLGMVVVDVTGAKRVEETLLERERALKEANELLERKNVALRELMDQVGREKARVDRMYATNIERVLLPLIRKLGATAAPTERERFRVLESTTKDLASTLGLDVGESGSGVVGLEDSGGGRGATAVQRVGNESATAGRRGGDGGKWATPREAQIAALVRSGLTSKEIGAMLNLSPRTVETHRLRLRRKVRERVLGRGALHT